MDPEKFDDQAGAQYIAQRVMENLVPHIVEGRTRRDLEKTASDMMLDLGSGDFWFHNIGAVVLSCYATYRSRPHRKYEGSESRIEENDIVTVDLMPSWNGAWGHYARTFVVKNGEIIASPGKTMEMGGEHKKGLEQVGRLHADMVTLANPERTYQDLAATMLSRIYQANFVVGEPEVLGHSITDDISDIVEIKQGELDLLGKTDFFVFLPHIKDTELERGYRRGDVYYFEGEELKVLNTLTD